MASLWDKTLFYLGLVDEEQGDDANVDGGTDVRTLGEAPQAPSGSQSVTDVVRPPGAGVVSGRRVEPPPATRRLMSDDREQAESGVYVHPTANDPRARRSEPESQIIAARNFSDAQNLADAVRAGRTVVLDLRSTEPEMVRRIVDFASGLVYALDGRMAKTAQGVILVSPTGVSLGIAEQERLSALGLYSMQG